MSRLNPLQVPDMLEGAIDQAATKLGCSPAEARRHLYVRGLDSIGIDWMGGGFDPAVRVSSAKAFPLALPPNAPPVEFKALPPVSLTDGWHELAAGEEVLLSKVVVSAPEGDRVVLGFLGEQAGSCEEILGVPVMMMQAFSDGVSPLLYVMERVWVGNFRPMPGLPNRLRPVRLHNRTSWRSPVEVRLRAWGTTGVAKFKLSVVLGESV